jgi:hypothetical protein
MSNQRRIRNHRTIGRGRDTTRQQQQQQQQQFEKHGTKYTAEQRK